MGSRRQAGSLSYLGRSAELLLNVFCEQVGFDIDRVADISIAHGSHVERMRNEFNAKSILRNVHQRQTDSVDSDRPLGRHLGGEPGINAKPEFCPFTIIGPFVNRCGSVDVARNIVAAHPLAHLERSFQIDSGSSGEGAQIGPLEGFTPGLKGELIVLDFHDRQTAAIDGDAVSNGGVGLYQRSRDREVRSVAVTHDLGDNAFFFNQSSKQPTLVRFGFKVLWSMCAHQRDFRHR